MKSGIAIAELREDFDELLAIARLASDRLDGLSADVGGEPRALLDVACESLLLDQARLLKSRYREAGRRLLALRAECGNGTAVARLAQLDSARAGLSELLRSHQLVVAALVSAADWQSPPLLSSTDRGVGAEFGRVRAHWNDYKRDRHLDAEAYERVFAAEMIDAPGDWRALLTACGMAAFTTVLAFLQARRMLDRPVVAGRALYHETKLLLAGAAPAAVFVDETDMRAVLEALRAHRPAAAFFDSLCNTRHAPLPDLGAIAGELIRLGCDCCLVIDNTALGPVCQPLGLHRPDSALRLIVFESLLKYQQLGLDRVNAGILVAGPEDAEQLDGCREHLGTNITDLAALALPPPRRDLLERRLRRIGRNAELIAERLEQARIDNGLDATVAHPGLPSHPSHALARRLAFRGGCVSVGLAAGTLEGRFIEQAIAEARRRSVPLVAGSSFGFDTTRVYLTAAHAEHGDPFVRIAAGSEHHHAAHAVAETLAAALVRTALW